MANPTSLSLTIDPFYIVTPGATYGLSGTLMDTRLSRPVQSQRIIFENGEGIPPINSTTTNRSGNFRVRGLRAPATVGDYNLRARFDGGGEYDPSQSDVITLRVLTNPTSLSLTIDPFYIVTPGATYGLSGTLMDTRLSRPVQSQRIIFENGEGIPPINSTTTNRSGNFRVRGLRAPATVGDYNLRARFDGGDGYDPSQSDVITLRVHTE